MRGGALAAAAAAARDAVPLPRRHVGRASALCAWVPRHVARGGGRVPRPPRPRGLPARAAAAAAALAIGRVEPPAPTAGAPFTLTVRVVDARGAPVGAEAPAAGPVVAIVSAAAVGPGGRGAPPARRAHLCRAGDVATFAPLRVDRPGTYVLRVAAAGLAAAAARVTVAPDPWTPLSARRPAAAARPRSSTPRGAPPRRRRRRHRAAAAVIARVPAGALVAGGRSPAARCSPPRASAATRPPGLPGPGSPRAPASSGSRRRH